MCRRRWPRRWTRFATRVRASRARLLLRRSPHARRSVGADWLGSGGDRRRALGSGGDGGAGSRHSPAHPQGEQRAVPHGGVAGSRTCCDGTRMNATANPVAPSEGGDPPCWSQLLEDTREDIVDRNDIELLVRNFYRDSAMDDVLGPVFEAAHVNGNAHVTTLIDLWVWQLLGEPATTGNLSERTNVCMLGHRRRIRTTSGGSSCSATRSTRRSRGRMPRSRRSGGARWRRPWNPCCRACRPAVRRRSNRCGDALMEPDATRIVGARVGSTVSG
jgi:hypothetical protein